VEGRDLSAATHLACARSQNSGNGILGYMTEKWSSFLAALFAYRDIKS